MWRFRDPKVNLTVLRGLENKTLWSQCVSFSHEVQMAEKLVTVRSQLTHEVVTWDYWSVLRLWVFVTIALSQWCHIDCMCYYGSFCYHTETFFANMLQFPIKSSFYHEPKHSKRKFIIKNWVYWLTVVVKLEISGTPKTNWYLF